MKLKGKPKGKKRAKKFRPVDEGLGSQFVQLTEDEVLDRAVKLAALLQSREEEVEAQAETRKAMKEALDRIDEKIHRLQVAIRAGREERPAPGLFDPVGATGEIKTPPAEATAVPGQ